VGEGAVGVCHALASLDRHCFVEHDPYPFLFTGASEVDLIRNAKSSILYRWLFIEIRSLLYTFKCEKGATPSSRIARVTEKTGLQSICNIPPMAPKAPNECKS